MKEIIQLASDVTGFEPEEITGKSRKQEIVFVRQALAFIYRSEYFCTLEQIGGYLNRDHTTVMHYLESHVTDLDCCGKYKAVYKSIFNACLQMWIERLKAKQL